MTPTSCPGFAQCLDAVSRWSNERTCCHTIHTSIFPSGSASSSGHWCAPRVPHWAVVPQNAVISSHVYLPSTRVRHHAHESPSTCTVRLANVNEAPMNIKQMQLNPQEYTEPLYVPTVPAIQRLSSFRVPHLVTFVTNVQQENTFPIIYL